MIEAMLDKVGLIGYYLISGDVGVFVYQFLHLSVSFPDIDEARAQALSLLLSDRDLRRSEEPLRQRRRGGGTWWALSSTLPT